MPTELFSLPLRNKEMFRRWNTYSTDVAASLGCARNYLGFHHSSLSTTALRLFETLLHMQYIDPQIGGRVVRTR